MTIRTLLIEDEEPSARYLQRLLRESGEVEVIGIARGGNEAVKEIDRLQPDLIFLDVEMPDLTGFGVLQQIQHKPIVVFLTAHGEYRAMAYETDAVAFLTKPVDADQIRNVIEKIRRMRQLPTVSAPKKSQPPI